MIADPISAAEAARILGFRLANGEPNLGKLRDVVSRNEVRLHRYFVGRGLDPKYSLAEVKRAAEKFRPQEAPEPERPFIRIRDAMKLAVSRHMETQEQ